MSNGFNFSDMSDDVESPDSTTDTVRYSTSGAAQEVINEAFSAEPQAPRAHNESVREKAIRQMEQANLYRVLLENDIFQPDSARPEIQDLVESEIKAFIEERLAVLLGISSLTPKRKESEFSDVEILALKALAAKVAAKMPDSIKKEEAPPTPAVRTVSVAPVSQAAVRTVAAVKGPARNRPAQAPTPAAPKSPPQPMEKLDLANMTPEDAREEIKRRKAAAGATKTMRPKKRTVMPSVEEQMQKYAAEVSMNSDATAIAGLLSKQGK
jgi:hypothetical protein